MRSTRSSNDGARVPDPSILTPPAGRSRDLQGTTKLECYSVGMHKSAAPSTVSSVHTLRVSQSLVSCRTGAAVAVTGGGPAGICGDGGPKRSAWRTPPAISTHRRLEPQLANRRGSKWDAAEHGDAVLLAVRSPRLRGCGPRRTSPARSSAFPSRGQWCTKNDSRFCTSTWANTRRLWARAAYPYDTGGAVTSGRLRCYPRGCPALGLGG
jgi:hypothetical protein